MERHLRRNLELKARCPGLAGAREKVVGLGARNGGTEIQTDSYFRVARGRLKLREIEGQSAVLIWYDRANHQEARPSDYYLVPVADAAGMKAALGAALGLRGQVQKRREIYLWHNVRIHLDEVAGLGTFIEFEAVLSPGADEGTAAERLGHLCQVFSTSTADHVAPSYSDLLGF
jgi:predicted adenylyl cyclase CyaB